MWNSRMSVFPTLAHENSKIEIRHKEAEEKDKKRGVSMEKSKVGMKEKRSPDGLNYSSGLPSP